MDIRNAVAGGDDFRAVASAVLVTLAALSARAWDVQVRADEETGGLISVGISGDPAGMNWIQGEGCTNMPWVTSEYRWGTGTLKVDGQALTWNRPISNADGCSVYRPVDGLEIRVRRQRKGDGLEETYEWRNVSAKPIGLSEIDIHTPFRDDYLPRREMWTRRCFAHVWAGGSSAWVCAMRMGGKAPHLGLAVTAGAVDAYEIKLRGQQTGSSDYRGVIALSPPDVTLAPGSSASVSWRLFPFADKTDFFRRVRELGGVSVTASDWTVTRDEPVDITFEWKGGKVTKRVAYVREGLVRVPFEYAKDKRTHAELNAIADPFEHVLRRARFLVAHQQVNEPDSPYYGAFTQYDMETGRQRRWWEVGGGPDMEPGAERLGIGVSLAVLAQLGYKDEFLPPLRRYADFILKLCRPDNYVYASLSPKSRKRDFNSPWAVEFFLEMYKLTDERRYLTKAYELMLANVLRKGTLIEVESPDSELVKVLRSAGLTDEADRMVNALVGHKDLFLRNARTSERVEEVGFAPEYASSRILQFLAAYDFVGDSRYLQDAVDFVPVFEANLGPQPSAWCHDIGLHHWDGFWFGKRRCWGDTMPNHWNGTGADAIAELARHGVAPGMDGRRAWSIGRQVLTLIRPDGGAGCAFVYPDRVNGRPAKFLDPLANDQDWVMLYYLRNSHGRASSPEADVGGPYFGVNYYAGFSYEYEAIRQAGLDHKAEIRKDVAHFRRLGLNSIRLHTFDVQFSTKDGRFVDNHHVELLDYLIDHCARNGIKTVLTPIAWWGAPASKAPKGFSVDWTIQQMVSDPKARELQVRFLREYMNHVNRYTGRRYADDPAIVAFELINEPHYPKDWPDEKVTEYIDCLVDAIRSTGCTKPLFYNCWEKRNAACGRSKIDGVTGNHYPTGLVADRELPGSQLGRVVESTILPDASVASKMRMIYEFDCADVGGAYMYPAMARLFRHEGCFAANQFQYDTLATAARNSAWKTHHLSLVYTPAKAISFAIAAEAFRCSPKGCPFVPDVRTMAFDGFRIDVARNLSQLVTETDYLYTADPLDPPPSPERLRRVWGVGSSSVAAVSGNGAYFLDRAAKGVWRLQLYPNVVDLRDPYCGEKSLKHMIVRERRSVKLALPDLGAGYRVRSARDLRQVAAASDGRVELMPGDYAVECVASFGEAEKSALAALGTAEFVMPPYPTASDFEFLDAAAAVRHGFDGEPNYRKYVCRGPDGGDAFGLSATDEQFAKGKASQHTPVEAVSFERIFGYPGRGKALCVRLRSADGRPGKLRINVTQANERYFGYDFPFEKDWKLVRVPLENLEPCWGTERTPDAKPDLGILRTISYIFSQSAEVSSVKVEF